MNHEFTTPLTSLPVLPSKGRGARWWKILIGTMRRLGLQFKPFYLFLETPTKDHLEASWARQDTDFAEYEVAFLGEEDMAAIAAMRRNPWSSEEASLKRLAEGEMCLGLKHKGVIVAYSWCDLNKCDSVYIRFLLRDDEAYLRDAYTIPAFRGRGLAPYIRYRLYQEMRQLGRTKFYSISVWSNDAALNFKRKLDARPILLGTRIKVAKKQNWSASIRLRDYGCPPFFRDRIRRLNMARPTT